MLSVVTPTSGPAKIKQEKEEEKDERTCSAHAHACLRVTEHAQERWGRIRGVGRSQAAHGGNSRSAASVRTWAGPTGSTPELACDFYRTPVTLACDGQLQAPAWLWTWQASSDLARRSMGSPFSCWDLNQSSMDRPQSFHISKEAEDRQSWFPQQNK